MAFADAGNGRSALPNGNLADQNGNVAGGHEYDRETDPRFNPPAPPPIPADLEEINTLSGDSLASDAGESEARPACRPADMELCAVSDLCRKALADAHDSPDLPHVYDVNGVCAIVGDGEAGSKTIREIAAAKRGLSVLKVLLTRLVSFLGHGANDIGRPVKPPDDAIMTILDNPAGLPRLERLVDIPTFRQDGSLIRDACYDKASGLYYAPAMPAEFDGLPDIPDKKEVREALFTLWKPFRDFPFENRAAKCNFVGFLLTPIARPLIDGNVPMLAISSTVQGAGKTTLAACLGIIAGKEGYTQMTVPERNDDEEVRKRLTSSLMRHPRVLVVDNLVGKFDSPNLASLLTTDVWNDRLLSRSEMVTLPMRAVVVATGVNIRVSGDLSRRTVMLQLVPTDERPWNREFPFDPKDYVREHRGELVRALIVLIRNWIAAGRPTWNGRRLGSFEPWCEIIGGILALAGMGDFLADWDTADSAANQELEELAVFYQAFANTFQSRGVTSAEFVSQVKTPDSSRLRDSLLE